jgi:tRNA-2-methylthio-N6-dimethylallyladenosine synthase
MSGYYIWTIGCQMNKAESERLGSYLEQLGYQKVASAEDAGLIVLNSCVVRQKAEDRVNNKINALRSLRRSRDLKLAVTGCLVNSEIGHLRQSFPHVDYFFEPGEYPPWIEKVHPGPVVLQCPSPSTFVPIIQGCNNFCSYCIVPYRRGREVSRPVEEIVYETKELVHRGAKEVTLLGQNVDSYGHDLTGTLQLADLLLRLNSVDGLRRIRFLTNHPKDMTSRLIESMASLDKVCEEISLPVQSGSDTILKAMGRGYNVERYLGLITEIRDKIPGAALSTDVIVGFPSETEEQFQETFDLLAALRFDTVHVAAYSPRSGTVAAENFADDVPLATKKERLSRVERLQEGVAREINARLLGKTVEVLAEGRKKDRWQGRTRGGKLVFFNEDGDLSGQLVNINIEKISPWALQGRLSYPD